MGLGTFDEQNQMVNVIAHSHVSKRYNGKTHLTPAGKW